MKDDTDLLKRISKMPYRQHGNLELSAIIVIACLLFCAIIVGISWIVEVPVW